MAKRKDLTGQRFGKLVVIGFAPDKKRADGSNRVRFNCVCDCGREVTVVGNYLTSGDTKTCGKCTKAKVNTNKKIKHGMARTRLYHIWCGMKQRCFNENNKDYSHYGGRGIKICEKWLDFLPFYEWAISNGYSDELTIDRIDVNGNYCPENCRWATQIEQ